MEEHLHFLWWFKRSGLDAVIWCKLDYGSGRYEQWNGVLVSNDIKLVYNFNGTSGDNLSRIKNN